MNLATLAAGALALLAAAHPAAPAGAGDLAREYPATLDWTEAPVGRWWTCGEQDVRKLASFELTRALDHRVSIELGPSTLAIGRAETGDALWAVVLPRKPGALSTTLPGGGEQVESVFLRFHPALVGELFPARTVRGRGDAEALREAHRLAAWKMSSGWQSGGLPVVPWEHWITADIETVEGPRRFLTLDLKETRARAEPAFAGRALPDDVPVTRDEARAVFDAVWSAFDAEYARFGELPEVDWDRLGRELGRDAAKARTRHELAWVLSRLLAPLGDLHVSVSVDGEHVPCARRHRPGNVSWEVLRARFPDLVDTKQDVAWSRTEDGIGYVAVYALSNRALPDAFDAVLEELRDAPALVLDLRANGGGDELLGRAVAGRFLAGPALYSRNRYRAAGGARDELGPLLERVVEPRGPWRHERPLAVLWGRRTLSSAESLALMLAQAPQATTFGDRTGGSSGNPRLLEPGAGLTVRLPRWLDLSPDGEPIEGRGVAPDVLVETPPEGVLERDLVLDRALEHLRGSVE